MFGFIFKDFSDFKNHYLYYFIYVSDVRQSLEILCKLFPDENYKTFGVLL